MSFSSMPSRRMIGVGGAEEIGRQRKRCVDTRDFLYFQRYFLLEHILINHVQNRFLLAKRELVKCGDNRGK